MPITSRYTAIVEGKQTGLAGCSNAGCPRMCLRADRGLAKDQNLYMARGSGCGNHIPDNRTEIGSD